MERTDKSTRSFWPREHGASGQLAMPLAAALAMGRPDWASVCLCAGAIAFFISHESLLVLIGARGTRIRREHGAHALRAGIAWVVLAALGAAGGLWLGGETVVRAALVPLAFVVTMTPLVLRRTEKTLAGEIVAAGALASAALPVAAAGGIVPEEALSVWAMWFMGFAAATAAVHRVILSHKGHRSRPSITVAIVATAAGAALSVRSPVYLASAPLLVSAWALILFPPHPRHIRRVGWTFLSGSLLTAVATVVLTRSGA